MGRMLQALKNLESRSVRPPAKTAASSEADLGTDRAALPLARVPLVAPPPPTEAETLPQEVARPARRAGSRPIPHPIAADEPASSAPLLPLSPVLETWQPPPPPDLARRLDNSIEVTSVVQPFAWVATALPATPIPSAGQLASPASLAPLSTLERQVQSTLSDPLRARPLIELGERVERDATQTASKIIVVVGVGNESATHETLLYLATLLARKSAEEVLLIDADTRLQQLSQLLCPGQHPGLADLLTADAPAPSALQQTAIARLSFLSAGLTRHLDLSVVGQRLESVLRDFANRFAYVLIDGGRSADLAATTLARLADAVYLIIQLGAVEMSEAQSALRDFRAAGARVLGCIAT